jgi:hypothetical protein
MIIYQDAKDLHVGAIIGYVNVESVESMNANNYIYTDPSCTTKMSSEEGCNAFTKNLLLISINVAGRHSETLFKPFCGSETGVGILVAGPENPLQPMMVLFDTGEDVESEPDTVGELPIDDPPSGKGGR